ncbi:MAG: hypothetical protein CVV17_01985 [Gammaproteobacteria bacterium HGW-Gammaproteobacteria-7]|nr:MAG: hypothetical protein CVV17_01985 [Gammaproteobacteria bacterium HGW-Gammaproteobacteria-7]
MNVEPIEAYLADLVGDVAGLDRVESECAGLEHAESTPEPVDAERDADLIAHPAQPTFDPPITAAAPPAATLPSSSPPDAQPVVSAALESTHCSNMPAEPTEIRPIVEHPTPPMPLAMPTQPATTEFATSPRPQPTRDPGDARAAITAARTNGAFGAQERNAGPAAHTDAWLAFKLNDQTFAIEVVKSQEVLLVPPVVPVRGTDPALLGLTNLRGLLVPVMDLSIRLRLPPARFDEHSRIIVLEAAGECLGLKVTSVGDVTPVARDAIEGLGSSLFSNGNRYARGIYRLAGRTMILLAAEELLKG